MRAKKLDADTDLRIAKAKVDYAVREDRWATAKARYQDAGDLDALKSAAIAYYDDEPAYPLHYTVIAMTAEIAALIASRQAVPA